jgi:CheY-like chemotaxis protein
LNAIQRIEEVKPHVLVVDLGMPEMDGSSRLITLIRRSKDAAIRHLPAAA